MYTLLREMWKNSISAILGRNISRAENFREYYLNGVTKNNFINIPET